MLSIFETLGLPELGIIVAVLLLFFGSKRMPEMARSLGRSGREFKRALAEGRGRDEASTKVS